MVKKRLALLGATGSIGSSTFEVVCEQSANLQIVLASAHSQTDILLKLAARFRIPNLVITDTSLRGKLKEIPNDCKVYWGEDELIKLLAELDYDIALNAVSGSAGLSSTMAVLQRGKTLALANKESLVMAGHLVKELQAWKGASIIPVDSEHSALFQAIGTQPHSEISKIHLTASGGTFHTLPLHDFEKITVEQALRHPVWNMGAKVTLDSATLFNKALEVMEAHWLFELAWQQIEVVIHPQSVIHSMVEFIDGSILSQLSTPDMKLPILYALSYPRRYPSRLVKTEITKLAPLTFESVDQKRYPLYFTGLQAGRDGGIMPTAANAANEAALSLFLSGKISFPQIAGIVERVLNRTQNIPAPDLETILHLNRRIYQDTLKSV